MSIVVLGSSGFIGRALCEHLRGTHHGQTTGYTSSDLDLTNPDSLDKLVEAVSDATTLVVAARAREARDPLERFSDDIGIASTVARCLARRPVRRCVYFSTSAVYGDTTTNLSIAETTGCAPTSLYGAAKFSAECVLRDTAERMQVPLIILRPCMVYGAGDTSQAYGPARFIRSILREGVVRIIGDGSEERDYLFIQDLVRITEQFMVGDHSGVFNLASGHSHSFQDLIACLRSVVPVSFEITHLDRVKPKSHQRLNPEKLLSLFPNTQFTELRKGLFETYQYFSRNLAR